MRITQHPTNNDVLGAPAGMTPEQCTAAPITRVQFTDGVITVRSYWRPTTEDLELLMLGGLVEVEVLGTTMPPMRVKATS